MPTQIREEPVIGVLLTAFAISVQLRQQSEGEMEKDITVIKFEEKLKIYREFLSKLHEVVKKENISDHEIKELIFQTSYIAMHTAPKRVNKILDYLKLTIKGLDSRENKYDTLAYYILQIELEMQDELYGKRLGEEEIDSKTFSALVTDIDDASEEESEQAILAPDQTGGLSVEDKVELQTYFWMQLLKELKESEAAKHTSANWGGKQIEGDGRKQIEEDVRKYYAKKRNRHRYFGFGVEVHQSHSGRRVWFIVEVENDYYYGFRWGDQPFSDDRLSQIARQVSPEYKTNTAWAGWRWPVWSSENTRHDLNFWKFIPHTGMKRLMDKSLREQFIKEIAKEMNAQILDFREKAKKSNL